MAGYGLTRQEQNTLIYIESYIDEHDRISPSYDEIAQAINVKSKSNVNRLVRALKSKGWVDYLSGHNRSIKIVRQTCPECPSCGAQI
jgi:SOS-response transcriptional repressor LexA